MSNDEQRHHDEESVPRPPDGTGQDSPQRPEGDATPAPSGDSEPRPLSPLDTSELDALLDMSTEEMDILLRRNYGAEATPEPLPPEPEIAPEPEVSAVVEPATESSPAAEPATEATAEPGGAEFDTDPQAEIPQEPFDPDPAVLAAAEVASEPVGPEPTDPDLPVHEQRTIEADTLTLADREEAREAALAGLKARAAANPPTETVPVIGAVPTEEVPADAIGGGDIGAPPSDAGLAAVGAGDGDDGPPRQSMWLKFLIASVMIIVSIGAATAGAAIISVEDILGGGVGGIKVDTEDIEAGEPQIFLILGSDKRSYYGENDNGLSDTAMLVRIDANKQITMFSIPRDLKVEIPGYGSDRFNAAYAYGGPKLTLQTIRQLTNQRIKPNHVINIDFRGFADVVNQIGCVYVDIDRRYYSPGGEYAAIDISAGYQRLCGLKALQYVRYRHNDNDLVRGARQQEFVREARQKMPDATELFEQRGEWIDIIKENMTTSISDTSTFVSTAKLIAAARNTPTKQIKFQVSDLGGSSGGYVIATEEQIDAVVSEFLDEDPNATAKANADTNPTGARDDAGSGEPASDSAEGEVPDDDAGDANSDGDTDGSDNGNDRSKKKKKKPAVPADDGQLIETTAGVDYAARITQSMSNSGKILFPDPVLYPTKIEPRSSFAEDSRAFTIDGGNKKAWNGYKIVLRMPGTTYPTAYYGVSGTNWVDAPLFRDPTSTEKMDKRTYQVYRDGDGVRMVAFKQGGNMYWVTNTLDKLLTPGQMMGIARSLRKYEPFGEADAASPFEAGETSPF